MKPYLLYIVLSLLCCISCADEKKKSNTDAEKVIDEEVIKEDQVSTARDTVPLSEALKTLENEKLGVPHHYICYTNDKTPSMQLAIAFDVKSNALFVRYKGQKDSILLENVKEDFTNDGAYPTITQFYNEMYNGKVNGTYALTHSGNWDYAKYTRAKDSEIFQFTIDHDKTVVGGTYRTTPCFE